jgi:hypothetical protein
MCALMKMNPRVVMPVLELAMAIALVPVRWRWLGGGEHCVGTLWVQKGGDWEVAIL